ncbi:hypothetical protein PLICRDRAFT_173115 [Plicaturopsis crispa FD-325 SS-3]|nr:hypothetical protein PLICRDRAFT_173115 [Plicaturopsis crispa FD-325 SS-3]
MSDPDYTDKVASTVGPKADARSKVIFSSLIRHLHAFAREVDLTTDEWLAACDSLIEAGQISGPQRNEMILISDVLGLEALLDSMAQERLQKAASTGTKSGSANATPSAILGPFYREGLPSFKNGESIVKTPAPNDVRAHVFGTLRDPDGAPISGATIDIWHTGSHGLYDSQVWDPSDPASHKFNWRGRFTTDEHGKYDCHCLRPTAYPIPFDHTAGKILTLLDRTPVRPAHIHFYVQAQGFHPLITQIYDSQCKYVKNDAVFAVKDALIVEFKDTGDHETELEYNIVLAKAAKESH